MLLPKRILLNDGETLTLPLDKVIKTLINLVRRCRLTLG